jgi:hypothetical protein
LLSSTPRAELCFQRHGAWCGQDLPVEVGELRVSVAQGEGGACIGSLEEQGASRAQGLSFGAAASPRGRSSKLVGNEADVELVGRAR